MSRASEWARQWQATRKAEPGRFHDPRRSTNGDGPYVDCYVGTDGTLSLMINNSVQANLSPRMALALASWIRATFGDEP